MRHSIEVHLQDQQHIFARLLPPTLQTPTTRELLKRALLPIEPPTNDRLRPFRSSKQTNNHVSQRTRCWRSRGIEPRSSRKRFSHHLRISRVVELNRTTRISQLGGASTTPSHGLGSSTSTTTTTHGATSGLTSGSGLTGSHATHDHLDRSGEGHRTSTGAAAANVTKPAYNNDSDRYDTDARNTTSGERGIGGGHGGPTAFESNPERVGTDRTHDGPRDHSLGGLTGSTVADVQRQGAGVVRSGDHDFHGKEVRGSTFDKPDTTKTHGDHTHGDHTHGERTGSNVPVVGTHNTHGERTGSNVPVVGSGVGHDHSSHSHSHGSGLAAGGLAAGGLAGAGTAAALGAGGAGGAKPSAYEGVVGDSVTGQQHFKGGNTGLTGAQTGTGAGLAGIGAGAGAAGAGLAHGHGDRSNVPAATGVSPATLSGNSGHHNKETGLVAELKQELKDHQKCESGMPHLLPSLWDSITDCFSLSLSRYRSRRILGR